MNSPNRQANSHYAETNNGTKIKSGHVVSANLLQVKPNDENGKLPTSERPFRVLIIAGSDRWLYNCPGVWQKPGVRLQTAWYSAAIREAAEGSSPAKQQMLGLSRNVTRNPKKSEGEQLRERC
jgi:hypothetical protein